MRLIIIVLVLLQIVFVPYNVAFAQTREEMDAKLLDESIEKLKSALTYNYFNAETDVHWSNRFFYNASDKTVSIRSISTDSPNAAAKKKVLDRTLKLEQLDPLSIDIMRVNENRGRIVEGTSIRIHTIGNERVIQRSFNGRASLKENVLEIPVPKYMEDSVQDYSNKLQEQLIRAIDLASRVYPTEDTLSNVNLILDVLKGQFQGENGSLRTYSSILHTAVEADEELNHQFVEKEIIGYDEEHHTFFRWTIHQHDASTMPLAFSITDQLLLYSEDKKYELTINGINSFTITKDGSTIKYSRRSF